MGAGRPKTDRTCDVDECEGKHYGKGLCSLHYHRQYHGIPLEGTGHGNTVVGYRAAHIRVEKARGKARIYFCVDCDSQAQEWSLRADVDDVLYSTVTNSQGKAYSLDVQAYEPRCKSCHRKADGIDFATGTRYSR